MIRIIIELIVFLILSIIIITQFKKKIKNELEQNYINEKQQELDEYFLEQKEKQQECFLEQKQKQLNELHDEQEKLNKQFELEKTYHKIKCDSLNKEYEQQRQLLDSQIKSLQKEYDLLKSQGERLAQKEYEKKLIENDSKLEKIFNEKYRLESLNYNQYLVNHQEEKDKYEKELLTMKFELNKYKLQREAINKAIIREKELKEKESFYKINLTDEEISDLMLIKDLENKFSNREILHKAVYECYIKKPLLEMEKRVLNGTNPCGIYKITYIPTGESYIGKSVDISKRWQEHAKSVFGCGNIASALVHTRIARDGIWNFTWEVLEEVPKDQLTEREKYWIDFYQTKEMGMNERMG